MSETTSSGTPTHKRTLIATIAAMAVVMTLAAYLRFPHLGTRSLWHDEFCTWQVYRMPLTEGLRWVPEIIPPLYQLSLRAITDDPHPSEWLLRLPAAICGWLVVPAVFWLGAKTGRRGVGLAAALLVAVCPSAIEYSMEARGYSILLLGSTLSVGLWYQVVCRGRAYLVVAYALLTAMTFYAHYLVALVVLAQIAWVVLLLRGRRRAPTWKPPAVGLALVCLLCLPLVIHRLSLRSVESGLTWVAPNTLGRAIRLLADATFGPWWLVLLLVAVAVWPAFGRIRTTRPRSKDSGRVHWRSYQGEGLPNPKLATLILLWLLASWMGLAIISFSLQPSLVLRYALPASVPAILLPLIVSSAAHRAAPLGIALATAIAAAPAWVSKATSFEPGFRELIRYIETETDSESSGVVLAMDGTVDPAWMQTERLALEYYPLTDRIVSEWVVDPSRPKSLRDPAILDPRELHVIVFRAPVIEALQQAGRRTIPYHIDGMEVSRLLLAPYRLLRVAPLPDTGAAPQQPVENSDGTVWHRFSTGAHTGRRGESPGRVADLCHTFSTGRQEATAACVVR